MSDGAGHNAQTDPGDYYRTRYAPNEARSAVWRHIAAWMTAVGLVDGARRRPGARRWVR